jgi:hypothetical protein
MDPEPGEENKTSDRQIGETAYKFITSIHGILQCCGPGSGIRCLFEPWMGKKSRSGSRVNIPDHISESLETIVDEDPGIFLTLDPDPGSATLVYYGTDLLFGLVEGGECGVSLLPEELPGAQERLRMLELPPLIKVKIYRDICTNFFHRQ